MAKMQSGRPDRFGGAPPAVGVRRGGNGTHHGTCSYGTCSCRALADCGP